MGFFFTTVPLLLYVWHLLYQSVPPLPSSPPPLVKLLVQKLGLQVNR